MTVFSVVIYILILRGHILIMGRGSWRGWRPAGAFDCGLYAHPSGPYSDVGAYLSVLGGVVIGGTDRTSVPSLVLWTFIIRLWILVVGRTNGYWGYGRLAGILCCLLYGHFSSTSPTSGAKVVAGGTGGLQVRSAVIWPIIHLGRFLPMGRTWA